MAWKALVNPEIKKHETSEYLIKGEFFDRSKFGHYGMGCSYSGIKSPRSMNELIIQVPKGKRK